MPPAGLQESSCLHHRRSQKETFAFRPLFEGARLKQGLNHAVGRALAEAELPCQIAQGDFRRRLGDTLQEFEGFLDGGRLVSFFFLAGIGPPRLFRIEFSKSFIMMND